MADNITLTIPDADWEPTGFEGEGENPELRLSYKHPLTINGQHFHVEAYAVEERDGLQEAADAGFGDTLERLQYAMDCAFTTQTIRGREYAIFITPHGV